MLIIGNAQGFWGDSTIAPLEMVEQVPQLDYLTLDYLSEVTMGILAAQRAKEPASGYAKDFIDLVAALVPYWKSGRSFKLIANAGGLNPLACASACQDQLRQLGLRDLKIGVVTGDDVTDLFKSDEHSVVAANGYLGAQPIVEALRQGAQIVITGRVADPSLAVAPSIFHYDWDWVDHERLANATVAGHLIECGTQVTGGISSHWLDLPNVTNIGFPLLEMAANGEFIITKPPHTGGAVNERTVKEQLLYEIGDPDRYLSPDVSVSFLSIVLNDLGNDRVLVKGAKGGPAPETYKVGLIERRGWRAEGMVTLVGRELAKKGELCGKLIIERLGKRGLPPARFCVECIGPGAMTRLSNEARNPNYLQESVLRICVADEMREPVELFSKEFTSLVTCGPQGVSGYLSGRPKVRPMYAFSSRFIEKDRIIPKVKILA